ncbi:TM0106 family RecB-like putative nuclease [Limnospira platensis CENA597]|uniref:TM0106 family RecB-like putative nuclease n=1 Tax=Limnospira platensis TaxID=118562 RepID=UPI003DA1A42E
MLIEDQQLLFYQRCDRRAFLDVYGDQSQKEPISDFLRKLIADSVSYRKTIIADRIYSQPKYPPQDWEAGMQATLELMRQGVDYIYRGVLLYHSHSSPAADYGDRSFFDQLPEQVTYLSRPDLLVKKPGVSQFGDWLYIPQDIRLGKRPKLDYQIVAVFHGEILAAIQGVMPEEVILLLRDRGAYSVDLKQRLPQMREIVQDYLTLIQNSQEPDIFISRQKCSLCQWYTHCHDIAQSQKNLCLLPGITPIRQTRLNSLNLTSVESLAQTQPEILQTYPEFDNGVAVQVIRQAESVWKNQAILKGDIDDIANVKSSKNGSKKYLPDPFWLQAPVELYFDIEAQPDMNLDYLHGVLVVDRRSQIETFYPMLAETAADEARIWQDFLALMWRYPIAPIFHFCDYEAKTISRLAKLYQTPSYLWRPLIKRLVDVHYQIVETVTLPVESYALKSIARWMGFEWRDAKANGAQCVCWYEEWLKTGDRTLLDAIVRYNEDDCRATYHVRRWLADFVQSQSVGAEVNFL